MSQTTAKALPFPTAAARRARDPWPRTVPEQTSLQEVLHDKDYDVRTHLIRSLTESYAPSLRRRANRLAACCTTARFYVEPSRDKVRPWLNRCMDRLCPFCSRKRVAAAAAKMYTLLLTFKRPRQIILTVRSTDAPLSEQLAFLRHSFARLRRSAAWKKAVIGGTYTIEVTANEQTLQWHPHVHVIYDGDYLPHQQLRAAWQRITEGSEVVWISDVHDRLGMSNELCKYVGKPARLKTWSANQIREYASSTSGARLLHNFGNCYGHQVDDRDENPPPDPEEYNVSLARVLYLASHGDPTAQRLAAAIADRWPTFAPFVYHAMPQLAPERTAGEKTLAVLAMLRGNEQKPPRGPPPPKTADEVDTHLLMIFHRFQADAHDGRHERLDQAIHYGYAHRS